VSAEPTRKTAGQNLAELCIISGDIQPYEKARKLLLEEKKVVPDAKVILWMQDIQKNQTVLTPPQFASKLSKTISQVDELLKNNPDNRRLLIARAQLAILQKDGETAQKCCEKVLASQPRHDQARLLLALAMIQKGQKKEAEDILYELKTDFPNWPDAQYSYATVENLMGKGELAKQALRHTVQIDPGHAGARRMLVEMMMKEGFYNNAYMDARAYYEAHPDDPKALELFVASAMRSDRRKVALEALDAAIKKYPDNPAMMLVAANGYSMLGESATARDVIRPAADATVGSWQERLAVVRAKMMAGQITQAENMLLDAAKSAPNSAVVYQELGNLYAATNRPMPAIENYRKSLSLDETNQFCRMSLAKMLFQTGLLKDALAEVQKVLDVEPTNNQAAILADQIRVILGIPTEAVASDGSQNVESESLLKLAMTFLEHGKPEKAIELCDRVLRNSPASAAAFLTVAQARLEQGRLQDAIDNCERAISCDPELLPTYLRMAVILSKKLTPEKVGDIFSKAASAKIYMEQMAMGWLYEQQGDWARAQNFYGRVIYDDDTPKLIKNMALLRKAIVQGLQGRVDEAFATLSELEKNPQWAQQALIVKAQVAVQNGRSCLDSLKKLLTIADEKDDPTTFEAVVLMAVQAGERDFAAKVCDVYRQASRQSARPFIMMGLVDVSAGRYVQAAEAYEQAVKIQPSNVQTRIMLAGVYNQCVMPQKALQTLDEMTPLSRSAKAQALYEKAKLLTSWGLQQPAIAALGELADMGFGDDPRVQFAMGVAYAALGRISSARDSLLAVPSYVPQYMPARQLVADLEISGDEKLRILNELLAANPDIDGVRLQKIRTLMAMDRNDSAAAEANGMLKKFESYGSLPANVADDLLSVLLKLELYPQSLHLAQRQEQATHQQTWAKRALAIDAVLSPAKVLERLNPQNADLYDSLIGMSAAAAEGSDISPWTSRFSIYANDANSPAKLKSTVQRYRTLTEILKKSPATGVESQAAMPKPVVDSLLNDKNRTKTAGMLILINVAADLDMPNLSLRLSRRLFEENRSCQWAVMDILSFAPPLSELETLGGRITPADLFAAELVRAEIAFRRGDMENACGILGRLSEKYPDNTLLMLRYGIALEQAGRLKDALKIYRKIWDTTGDVVAANNAASIVGQLFPKDPDELSAASELMTKVLQVAPSIPAFLDTKGWIEYLRGNVPAARKYLLAGIMGLGDSIEAHYHVGM
ncbi:MAG TPA: tetratricopeptide repeat protein, partial [Phycisphaerae bacterium]|nr:tetratricopeptide repeat protein [Phycisphaerae bacterium]